MIKLKGSKYFTKLDIRWGYNNVRIKEGDEWKATFITNKGLFEPTVMFFGLHNSPATFQAMMDDYFRDMIDEGWITIYMDDILIHAKMKKDLEDRTVTITVRTPTLCIPDTSDRPCYFLFNLLNLATPLLSYAVRLVILTLFYFYHYLVTYMTPSLSLL